MRSSLVVGALAAMLGGCGAVAALEQMDREADQRTCDSFGFRRATDAYSNCMMQRAAQREDQEQRAQRSREREAFERDLRRR